MGEKKRILVVDDDQKLRELLSRYLQEHGYEVDLAEDGEEMDRILPSSSPNLIVLDLMMPGEDGLSIARRLRADSNIPIIILSAKGEEIDKVVGLEMGADDYLAKPFNPRELLARIQAVLRRLDRPDEDSKDQNILSFGDYQIDLNGYSLTKNGEAVELTSGEFELLKHLVEHPNHVLSRDHLLDLLDGGSEEAFDRSIDVRITRLRKKIEEDPHHPLFIKTVRGVGYIFSTK